MNNIKYIYKKMVQELTTSTVGKLKKEKSIG